MTVDMVLAVYWPPHAPAAGQATFSSSCKSASRHFSGGVGADGFEDILNGHVFTVVVAGGDGAAIEHEAREG